MEQELKEFRRLNFFKGLFTSAEDWRAEQAYHINKQCVHNLELHSPGVVSGLEVKPSADGTALQIAAGHAIDNEGRHLRLIRDVPIRIDFDNYPEPTTVFVVFGYKERLVDVRNDPSNEKSNYAFVEESPQVVVQTEEPKEALPLARIRIDRSKGKRLLEASNPGSPKENEIDTKQCPRSGARGARTSLKDSATVAQAGEIKIGPHREGSSTQYEAYIEWSAGGDVHAFHFASVYPIGTDGEVSWRMGALRVRGELKYRLFIRNHEDQGMTVSYRVYRLN